MSDGDETCPLCKAGVPVRGRKVLDGKELPKDPLRNNPIVGFMSEEQAQGILDEMRNEGKRRDD